MSRTKDPTASMAHLFSVLLKKEKKTQNFKKKTVINSCDFKRNTIKSEKKFKT